MAFLTAMAIGAKIQILAGNSYEELSKLSKGMESVDKATLKLGMGMGALSGVFAGMAAVGAGVTVAVTGIALQGLAVAGAFEQAEIAFTTMLGSGEAAKKFLGELEAFAAKTPFEFPELLQAARSLKAFGFSTEEVLPLLTTVGDAVAALGGGSEEVNSVTRALGKMRAKGKVGGEEMMLLAERGIPAWKMLADTMGTDIAGAMDQVSKGAVTADVFIKGFKDAVTRDFGGAMDKLSTSMLGLMSTMSDESRRMLRAAFTPWLDTIKPVMIGINTLIGQIADGFAGTNKEVSAGAAFGEGMKIAFDEVRVAVTSLVEQLTAMTGIVGPGLAKNLGIATIAVIALTVALTPVAAVLAVVVGLVAALVMAIGAIGWVPLLVGLAVAVTAVQLLLPLIGLLGIAFLFLRGQGESIGDTFTRWWGIIKAFTSGVLEPFRQSWVDLSNSLSESWDRLVQAFSMAFDLMALGIGPSEEGARSWGETIGVVLVKAVEILVSGISVLSKVLVTLATFWTGVRAKAEGVIATFRGVSVQAKVIGRQTSIVFQAVRAFATQLADMGSHLWRIFVMIHKPVVDLIIRITMLREAIAGAQIVASFLSGKVQEAGSSIAGFAVKTMLAVSGIVTRVGDRLSQVWAGIKTGFIDPFVSGLSSLVHAFDPVVTRIESAMETIVGALQGMADRAREIMASLLGTIMSVFVSLMDTPIGRQLFGVGMDVKSAITTLQSSIAAVKAAPVTVATEEHAKRAASVLGEEQRQRAAASSPEVAASVTVEGKQSVTIKNELTIDGKKMAIATKEAEVELTERAGFSLTPWQRRSVLERGATPIPAM